MKLLCRNLLRLFLKKNKNFKKNFSFSFFNFSVRHVISFLVVVIIFGSASYGVYALIDKINSEVVVSQQEIIFRVKKHLEIPSDNPQSVVRVEDASNLKSQNEFFKDVKEGDYVILYDNMAIIYNLKKDEVEAFRRSNR